MYERNDPKMNIKDQINLVIRAYIDPSRTARVRDLFSQFATTQTAFAPIVSAEETYLKSEVMSTSWHPSVKIAYKEIKEKAEFNNYGHILKGEIIGIDLNQIANMLIDTAQKKMESKTDPELAELIEYLAETADDNRPRKIIIPVEIKQPELISTGKTIFY